MNNLCRKFANPNILRYFITPMILEKVTFSTFKVSNSVLASTVLKYENLSNYLIAQRLEFQQTRSKSKKLEHDENEEEENDFEDTSLKKDSKVVKLNTTSMRSDLILKSALGLSRNKIEEQFYESRIRLNGKKLLKKSTSVKVGDELDLVKMVSPKNSDHIYVARVEILKAAANENSISITVRRFRNLLIENYAVDPYKGGPIED